MRKRIFALFLILVLVMIGLPGCSKENDVQSTDQNTDVSTDGQEKEEGTEAAVGRYMEKEVVLPELEENESITNILQNENKQFEIYTLKNTDSGSEYHCYVRQEDLSWEKSNPGWLNNPDTAKLQLYIEQVCRGEDGNYYASCKSYSEDYKSVIIKASSDGNTAETLDLSYLNEAAKVIEGTKYYPMLQKIGVLKSGMIVLSDAWNSNGLLIVDSTGKKIDEVKMGESQNFLVSGNNIIVSDEDGNIITYNTEDKMIVNTSEYGGKTTAKAYALMEEGTLLMGDSDGIHRLAKDGTLWETTVDGSLNSMSMPSLNFTSLFVTEGEEQEEYYAAYTDAEIGYQLKQYVFDKNVTAVPEKEITVYSLKENNTIRQAISLFQAQNDDVKVNYVVAMGEEESGNVSDYIRALNTELFSGNGADILLLDGLPTESYIEKGVLADISDIINNLEQSDAVLANVSESFYVDGKVYRMPIRFGVPILLGKEDALNSSDNLNNLVAYIEKTKKAYAAQTTYAELLKDYLALYWDDLYENGELGQDRLKEFLENMKVISDNCKATEVSEEAAQTNSPIAGFYSSDSLFQNNFLEYSECEALLEQMNNVSDTMLPYSLVKDNNLKISTIGQKFIPKGLVGLNNASKEMDIAKQFISFLFTSKVQDTNLYDGFPVNAASLQKWFDEDNQDIMLGVSDQEGRELTAVWPTKEEREAFLKAVLETKKPIETNQILSNMILESAIPYLSGEAGIDQVTSEIKAKVNTYLAE